MPVQEQRGQWQGGQAQRGYGTVEDMNAGSSSQAQGEGNVGQTQGGGEENNAQVPPSYEQAVKGDHKVQT